MKKSVSTLKSKKTKTLNPYTSSTQFKCQWCKEFTPSIDPFQIRRTALKEFHVRVICDQCKLMKSKYLNDDQLAMLPDYFFTMPLKFTYLKYLVLADNRVIELYQVLRDIVNDNKK